MFHNWLIARHGRFKARLRHKHTSDISSYIECIEVKGPTRKYKWQTARGLILVLDAFLPRIISERLFIQPIYGATIIKEHGGIYSRTADAL